jgi:hypothetical protein
MTATNAPQGAKEAAPAMGENDPESPRRIGRYEIRRELGRGMMGVVYEAVDPALGRTIALKTIQLSFALGPSEHEVFEQRFFAEARIAARLSHPGIVVVHDVGRDDETGLLYMALEHLEGRTLAEVIKQGTPVDWRERLHIVRRVAEALHHAHTHGVIHRDIKPGNIMLLRSGEPKIMDFGIAKVETARIQLTAAGQFFGTPLYMSPEQALGRTVDCRSDLFSLGAITYSLLTSRPAFAAENLTKIITRVIHDEPPPPSRFVSGLPPEVDYLVARALAKNPADRYPDGQRIADDIEDVLVGRRPRHLSEWALPGAVATLVPAQDLEDAALELERLLAQPSHQRHDADLATVDLAVQLATLVPNASQTPTAEVPPPEPEAPRRLGERFEPWTIALVLLVGLAAALISLWARQADTERPPPSPTEGPRRATGEPARLEIEFEHALRGGLLRVWVDRELVVEQRLDGRPTTIMAFSYRKGGVQEFLALSPGGHDVEVRVAWDDDEKTERIWGDFKSGTTRRLRARIGGFFKKLSLDWR